MVCHLVAPNARLPSEYDLFIDSTETSEAASTVGKAISASVSPPERTLHPNPK